MLSQIYLHKNYAKEVIPNEIYENALKVLEEEYPTFNYNCVMYDTSNNMVRFDEAPDFDTAREPKVGNFIKVMPNGEATKGSSSNIWHHKWLWVKDDYSGFNVEESKLWSAKWLGILTETAKGTQKTWDKQLENHGLK